nr:hypothetical protein [uncultured Microbacterium sp.]
MSRELESYPGSLVLQSSLREAIAVSLSSVVKSPAQPLEALFKCCDLGRKAVELRPDVREIGLVASQPGFVVLVNRVKTGGQWFHTGVHFGGHSSRDGSIESATESVQHRGPQSFG